MKNGILNQLKQLEYDFCNKIILYYKKNVLSAKKMCAEMVEIFFCHYFSFYDFDKILEKYQ